MIFTPGIFFGLDEAEYHAVPALSNSGIKNLLISPLDFWARSWLNPDRENEESPFMELGKAYHKRILEGRDAFYRQYAVALDPADYPNALRTVEELKAALPEGAKRGGSKADLIARIAEASPDAEIWDTLEREHAEFHAGKTLLSAKAIRRLEVSAAMIEKHPDLGRAFTGGMPEVSIFWRGRYDEELVPMKARLDYLKTQAIVDLKTHGNAQGKPIDRAVAAAMASQKYHIQAAVYQDAVEAAKAMLRDGSADLVHGEVDGAWLKALTEANEHAFLFVFQATGVAPVARGYQMTRSLTFDCGRIAANEAKRRFLENMKLFGSDPWVDQTPVRPFDDTEFPAYMTEA